MVYEVWVNDEMLLCLNVSGRKKNIIKIRTHPMDAKNQNIHLNPRFSVRYPPIIGPPKSPI